MHTTFVDILWRMIRKSVQRFSEKIMRKQWIKARWRFDTIALYAFRTPQMPNPDRPWLPKLMSFDVFGTLISVRDSSYGAFERILAATSARNVDVREFWEAWEHRNIERYWLPYQSYRAICRASL